jgi:ATP-binding cassette subfamily B (MDR/TAP) protein 1
LTIDVIKASGAAEQLFKTINQVSEIDTPSDKGLTSDSCKGGVEVKDLYLSYSGRQDFKVLNGLNLKIPSANTSTALVGASGFGKSTTVGLLER